MLLIGKQVSKIRSLKELVWAMVVGLSANTGPNESIQMPPRGTDTHRVSAPDPKGQSWLVVHLLGGPVTIATKGFDPFAFQIPVTVKVFTLLTKTNLTNPHTETMTLGGFTFYHQGILLYSTVVPATVIMCEIFSLKCCGFSSPFTGAGLPAPSDPVDERELRSEITAHHQKHQPVAPSN